MSEKQPIETAPKDGIPIRALINGYGWATIAWDECLLDSLGRDCGGWIFIDDREPPDSWTEGVCWEVNEDGCRSAQPTHWMPLSEKGE